MPHCLTHTGTGWTDRQMLGPTGTTGSGGTDLSCQTGDATNAATPLAWNPGGDSGPRFVPMRQRRKEVRAGRDREGCVGRKEGIWERDRQIQGQ